MFVTVYMSRAQRFEVKTGTDDRGEIKVEIASAFDKVTVGLNRDQAAELAAKVSAELGTEIKKEVPF